MNKLIYSVAAVAALFAGGAWAQADCQAGSAWGTNPGCGPTNAVPPIVGNSGWTPPYYYPEQAVIPGIAYPQLSQVLPQQVYPYANATHIWVDPSTGQQYSIRPRRNDRDGDGVRDNRDRYPDDPRFR
ncbi:hypothetical protein [Ramlibacter albus]|uniref:RcnB family protein n=1 Tax=Ramlibacter albus TaxID=2079448 RepID=A0A923M7L2_9BURK|nr:hypothetical protein [Ramlibacter albus]MBC5765318.1 hypothetical protein [Ramlibacter albus]